MLFSYGYGQWQNWRIIPKCTSITAHFEGLMDVLEQYRRHCPMRHVLGYPKSHWMPPLGNYLLRIAPVANRATANKKTTKSGPTLLTMLMASAVCRYVTVRIAQWKRSRALVEASGCCHWASIAANSIEWTWLHCFLCLSPSTCRKRLSWC